MPSVVDFETEDSICKTVRVSVRCMGDFFAEQDFRAPWTKQLISWFIDTSRYLIPSEEVEATKYLRTMYRALSPETLSNDQSIGQPIILPSSSPHTSANFNHEARIKILTRSIEEVLPSLLVLAHDSLSTQDWETILPFLWVWYGTKAAATREIGFMLEKCAEVIPAQLRSIIISDLTRYVQSGCIVDDHIS